MTNKKRPKTLWATSSNQFGLYTYKPLLVTWDDDLESYWAEDGNFEVAKEGYYERPGTVHVFASQDKAKVQQYIDDYKAAVIKSASALRHELLKPSPGAKAAYEAISLLYKSTLAETYDENST